MELFREDGCLTDEGLLAVTKGGLDELGRLETAEHLSYCDRCMDRYTALLTADALETPPKPLRGAVMSNIWVRLMQNTYGRVAVASVAAVPEPQGKPVETRADRDNAGKLSGPLQRLLDTVPHTTESNATT